VDDDDAPIYVDLVGFATEDPLLDYAPDPIDVLLDQCRTIINLQERIMSIQDDINAIVASLAASVKTLSDAENAETEKAPLDLSGLRTVQSDLDALNAKQEARLNPPAPAAPVDAAPVIDLNTGQPVVEPAPAPAN
jgi:hypothetical protein